MRVHTAILDDNWSKKWVQRGNPLYLHASKGRILLNARGEFDIPSLVDSGRNIPTVSETIDDFVGSIDSMKDVRVRVNDSDGSVPGFTRSKKAMQTRGTDKAVFWDTESIGAKDTGSWGITELAWSNTEGKEGHVIINPFESEETDSFFKRAMDKVAAGKEGDLDPDERRSILDITKYSDLDKDGNLVSINKGYNTKNTTITENIYEEAKRGYANLKTYGAKRKDWTKQFVDNIDMYEGLKVAHNGYNFDIPLIAHSGVTVSPDGHVDSSSLARKLLLNKENDLFNFTQDDLYGHYFPDKAREMSGRHTALGDVRELGEIFGKMTENPIDFGSTDFIGKGSVFVAKGSAFRSNQNDVRLSATGAIIGKDSDRLFDHQLIRKNNPYSLEYVKRAKNANNYVVGLRNLETDELSIISKKSKDEVISFFEQTLGQVVGDTKTYGANVTGREAYSALFRPDTGFANTSTQLNIYDAVKNATGKTSQFSAQEVRDALQRSGGHASDLQINRFIQSQDYLATNYEGLRRIVAGVQDSGVQTPQQRQAMYTFIINQGKHSGVQSLEGMGVKVNSGLTLYSGDNFATSISSYINSTLPSTGRKTSDYIKSYHTLLSDMKDTGLISEVQRTHLFGTTDQLFRQNVTDNAGRGIMALNEMISSTIDMSGSSSLYGPYIPSSFAYANHDSIATWTNQIKKNIGYSSSKDILDDIAASFQSQEARDAFTGKKSRERFQGIVKADNATWRRRKSGVNSKGQFVYDRDSIQGKLDTFITSMQKRGIGVSLTPAESDDSIRLALFDLKNASAAVRPGEQGSFINPNVSAMIDIPVPKNGQIHFGRTTVDDILVPYWSEKENATIMATKSEQVVHGLNSRIDSIAEAIANNDIDKANNIMRGSVRRTLEGTAASVAAEKGEKKGILLATDIRNHMRSKGIDVGDELHTIAVKELGRDASAYEIGAYEKLLLRYGYQYDILGRNPSKMKDVVGYDRLSSKAKYQVESLINAIEPGRIRVDSVNEVRARAGKATTESVKDLVPFGTLNTSVQHKADQGTNTIPIEKARLRAQIDKNKAVARFERDNLVAQQIVSGEVRINDRMLPGVNVNYAEVDDTFLFNLMKDESSMQGKGAVIPTVRDDMAVISSSMAESIGAYQDLSKDVADGFQLDDKFAKALREASGENGVMITQDLMQNLNVDDSGRVVVGGILEENGKTYKRLYLNQGDVFMGFEEALLENGEVSTRFNYRRWRGVKDGTKLISTSGNRVSVIISDEAIAKTNAALGTNKNTYVDILMSSSSVKSTNLGTKLGDLSSYIFNAADEQQQEIIKSKLANEYKNTLGQYIKFDDKTGKFVYGQLRGDTDYVSGTVRDLINLGNDIGLPIDKQVTIDGKDYNISLGNLTVGQINDHPYKAPIGFSSAEYVAENSPLRYGSKEITSGVRNIAEMEKMMGVDLSELKNTAIGVRDFNASPKVQALREEFKNVQQSVVQTAGIKNGSTSVGDFVSLTAGGVTSEYDPRKIELSEVYNKVANIDPTVGPGLQQEAYESGTYNRIFDRLKGTSNEKSFVLDIKGSGINLTDTPDQIVIPKVAPTRVNGTYMPSEVERRTNNIFDALYEYSNASSQEAKNVAAGRVGRAVNDYYGALGNTYLNKDSQIVKDLTSTHLANAMSFKASGVNAELYLSNRAQDFGKIGHHSMENTIVLSKDDIRKALTIDKENLSQAAQGDALLNLKREYKYMHRDADEAFLKSIDSMGESELIDNILNNINVDGPNGGKHLTWKMNRFPTFSDHDMRYVRIVTSDSAENGVGRMSPGLASLVKADYDGDKPYVFAENLNRHYKDDAEFMKARAQMDIAEEAQGRIASIQGRKVINDYKAGLNSDSFRSMVEGLDDPSQDNKLRNLIQSISGEDRMDDILALAAQEQKEMVGKYSIYGANIKRMAEETGMIGRGLNPDLFVQGKTIEAFTNSLEQNAISFKKLGDRVSNGAFGSGKELVNWLNDTNNNFYQAVRNRDWSEVGRIGEVLGFFGRNDSGNLVLNSDHAQMAMSTIQGTLEKSNPELAQQFTGGEIEFKSIINAFDTLQNRTESVYGPHTTIDSVINSNEFRSRNINYSSNPTKVFEVMGGIAEGSISGLGEMVGDYASDEAATVAKAASAKTKDFVRKASTVTGEGTGSAQRAIVKSVDASADKLLSNLGSKVKAAAPIALGLGAVWALTAAARGPRVDQTPANQQEEPVYDEGIANQLAMSAPAGTGPTARITPNTIRKPATVKINAKSVNGLTNEDVFGIIEREMNRQAGTNVNLQMTHRDDRTSMDDRWFDQKVSKLL